VKKLVRRSSEVHPVEVAVRDFEAQQRALKEFMAANDRVFDQFNALVDAYNRTLVAAKGQVRDTDALQGVYVGPFTKTKAPESVTFDAAKLPDKIKKLPGVLTADNKVLKALIEGRTVSVDDVRDAMLVTVGTPRVTGPKEIEVKL